MKQLLCCSYTGSFNGFLQLPINSIFPLSVVYEIMGWGLFVCMYSCMYVCMHQCMYISVYACIMHACVCSVYVCMYHTYVHDACMYAMDFFYKITF